jgi:small-conductance mechanosensitive channel
VITTETIIIQLFALLICYLSVAVDIDRKDYNLCLWDDKKIYKFIISVFVINLLILIVSSTSS